MLKTEKINTLLPGEIVAGKLLLGKLLFGEISDWANCC